MRLTSALAIYLLFWSLTLFAVLPLGVRTWHEDKATPVPGQADSAPQNPQLARKALLTTVIASVLFGIYYANYVNGWITMDDFLPSVRPPGVSEPR